MAAMMRMPWWRLLTVVVFDAAVCLIVGAAVAWRGAGAIDLVAADVFRDEPVVLRAGVDDPAFSIGLVPPEEGVLGEDTREEGEKLGGNCDSDGVGDVFRRCE